MTFTAANLGPQRKGDDGGGAEGGCAEQQSAECGSAAGGGPPALTLPQLAHELNSLLDGSLRCLALAGRELASRQATNDDANAELDDVRSRLCLAEDGLRQMAELLERTMRAATADLDLFDRQQPLAEQVRTIVQSLEPMAAEAAVELALELTPRCAHFPSRTLGPVIMNGLRNAIEACADSEQRPRRVELSIAVRQSTELIIIITDSGAGVSINQHGSGGHGCGLQLSRLLVQQLGGQLRLSNVPFGPGAVLQAIVPLAAMQRSSAHRNGGSPAERLTA